MVTRRKSDSPVKAISPAEWEVMKVLWEGGPMAARDVFAALPPSKEWSHKTLKTLLARLVTKGAVDYQQVGNSYLYRAACDRAHVARTEMRSFIDRVLGGSLFPVLQHFIEEHDLSEDELRKLQEMLDRREGAKGMRKKGARK
jgi:BlaI family transcriptional regulator, penicillinase repressor